MMPSDPGGDRRPEDRRVRRTRRLLHGALASLIHEKPFGAIGVKEILARADVGRSTFYTHFRDKEALLASAIRETLAGGDGSHRVPADPAERVLRFSLPLLEHIERVEARRPTRSALRRPRAHAGLHDRVRPVLVEWISAELEAITRDGARLPNVPPDLLARQIADTFLCVLEWSTARGEQRGARELNEVFRALTRPVLAVAASGHDP